jgi:hypothetical protein
MHSRHTHTYVRMLTCLTFSQAHFRSFTYYTYPHTYPHTHTHAYTHIHTHAHRARMHDLRRSMERHGLPADVRQSVLRFYDYRWSRTKGNDDQTLLSDLPQHLQDEVCMHEYIISHTYMSMCVYVYEVL